MNYTKNLLLSLGMIFCGQLANAGGGGFGQELFRAVTENNEAKVKELISKGADVNWKNPELANRSILVRAVRNGNTAIVKDLLAAGANPNAKDKFNESVLHQAVLVPENMQGDDIIEALLRNNANIDDTDSLGRTALIRAAGRGYAGFVKILVDNNANVNLRDKRGESALDLAKAALPVIRELAQHRDIKVQKEAQE